MSVISNLRYSVKRGGYNEAVENIRELTKAQLEAAVINEFYNDWCRNNSDPGSGGPSKTIPYMGWFWRDMDFAGKDFTVADNQTGDYAEDNHFIAFCENNKWGFDQRQMTPDEAVTFINFIDAAMNAPSKSDELNPVKKADVSGEQPDKPVELQEDILKKMREWMMGLII